jgi:DNA-binding NarL/FixJ family response regulator
MKILVVHRQASVLNQVKDILQDNQTVIRYYNSGLDGLLAARVEEFDLIVCGTDLPVITGYEMIRSLRNHSINSSKSVVFIADEITDKLVHLGKALGVAGVFSSDTMSMELQSMLTFSK